MYIVISNNIVILIKLVKLGDGEAAGHQERTQSDPHQPQVSVPLISRSACGQPQKGRDHSPTRSPVGGGVFRYIFSSSFRVIT